MTSSESRCSVCGGYFGNVVFRVVVISATMERICCGSMPGGRAAGDAGVWAAEVEGGFGRGAMGVFSLFSCDELELVGSIGDEGSGDRKLSVGSESICV